MTHTDISQIVLGFFGDALNSRDVDKLDRYCSQDYVWNGAEHGLEDVRGMPAFKELCRSFFRAFPDFRTEVHDVVVGGDKVVARYVEGGTFSHEFFGYPPTGTEVFWPGIAIYRIEDGKIAEEWFQTELELRVRAASEAAQS